MAAQLMSALMQLSLLAGSSQVSYSEAYAASQQTGKPMLVLIGADWCPHCVTMKNQVIPQVERDGSLQQVSYVPLNSDRHPALAQQMMQGNSVPQLVLYYRTAEGWQRRRITGGTSAANVSSLIQQAVKAVAANPPASPPTIPVSDPSANSASTQQGMLRK